jgi:hypothetical protein
VEIVWIGSDDSDSVQLPDRLAAMLVVLMGRLLQIIDGLLENVNYRSFVGCISLWGRDF